MNLRYYMVVTIYLVCAVSAWIPAAQPALGATGNPTFPADGYGSLLHDIPEPDVPDDMDITEVGYQHDATHAFFRITVVSGASFAANRFFLYFDLDADGLPDCRLRNTSAVNATFEAWSGTQYQSAAQGWCDDPDNTPDVNLDLACDLVSVNDGNFQLTAAAAAAPSTDDPTIRDPSNNPNFDEVTGGSTNPTAVLASDFRAVRDGAVVRLQWRAVSALAVGFNVYVVPDGGGKMRRVNANLIPLSKDNTYKLLVEKPPDGTYQLEAVMPDGGRRIVTSASTCSPRVRTGKHPH